MATDNVVPIGGASDSDPPKDGADASSGGWRARRPAKKKEIDHDRLDWLSTNFALIYGTDTVFDDDTGTIMRISAMAHAHTSDYVKMWKARPSSDIREPKTRWTVMPDRVVFDPGLRRDPNSTVNLFRGMDMEPFDGDAAPMLELLDHLLSRVSEVQEERGAVRHWLLCWLAYPLQRPGAKMRSAVVMHGDEGAGKNFFFETHLKIYGKYGKAVGQDELEDKFNDWRSCTLFVVADEASSRQELVHNKNRLKALITSPTVQINPKGMPRREESNHMNIVFLSNELTPLALDNTDRRYLVVYTPPEREPDFYKRLGSWLRLGDGPQAWLHFLKCYDIKGFDMFTKPPMTSAKRDLIDLNRKSPERFWVEWSNDELTLPYRSCSVSQAYRAYTRYAIRIGDRYPVQKELFSRMVGRISDSMKKPTSTKTMKVALSATEPERATRMLLVAKPVIHNGVTEGQWASDAVRAFESDLALYMRSPHSPDSQQHEGDRPQ